MKPFCALYLCGLLGFAQAANAQNCLPAIKALNGLTVNLLPANSPGNKLVATVYLSDFAASATSACAPGPLTFAMRKSGTGTGMPTDTVLQFNCDEVWTQLVEIWARDAAGNANYTETYVLVQDHDLHCDTPLVPPSFSCANDGVAPRLVAMNGLSTYVLPAKGKKGWARIDAADLVVSATDNCSGPITLRLRKSGTGTGVPKKSYVVFNCDELGTQLVDLWAGDAHGNWAVSETYVIVQDNINVCDGLTLTCTPTDKVPPVIVAYNGMSLAMTNNLSTTVSVSDLLLRSSDFCSGIKDVRLGKYGEAGPNPPSTQSLTFTCAELGTQLIVIWVEDKAGNWGQVETYVIVQDNAGVCAPAPAARHNTVPAFKQQILDQIAARVSAEGTALYPASDRDDESASIDAALSPNPSSGTFTLSATLEAPAFGSVLLYDQMGRQVRVLAAQQRWDAGEVQQTFSIGELPAGTYWCVFTTDVATRTMPLVKE